MPTQLNPIVSLSIAPAQVVRGFGAIEQIGDQIARFGRRPLMIGGDRSLDVVKSRFKSVFKTHSLQVAKASYQKDCSEVTLVNLKQAVADHQADFIIGVGGGKALDTAKLVAYQCNLPIVTVPTSAATCAAWTALSNVYSDQHAFLYDVG
jgi:glycerol dehydrogenase-like iron-containing ADH family enzyme